MQSNKIQRAIFEARKTAKILPSALMEIARKIPEALINDPEITAQHLALVVLALNRHWHDALTFREKEIIDEGCVYDPDREELLEVVSLKDKIVLPRVI